MTGTILNAVEGVHTVEANGQKYEGLKKWTTEVPVAPAAPAVPETPVVPVTPSVPTTTVPDAEVPKTGASVLAISVMALVSLAGAGITKKR